MIKRTALSTWFLAAGVLIAANTVVCYVNVQKIVGNVARVTRSREIMFAADRLLSTLKDAETGQRGYLITGNAGYLDPYHKAVGTAEAERVALATLVAGDAAQVARVESLRRTVVDKLNELERTIDLFDKQGYAAAKRAVDEHLGKSLMEDARRVVEDVRRAEQANLKRHTADREDSSATARVTLIAAGAFNVLLLAGVGLAVRQDARSRAAAAREAQAREALARDKDDLSRDNSRLSADVDERRRANDALTALATRLEQSNRELQDFASVASHDLQEPLRKIQAFGDRLRSKFADALGDTGRDYVDRMHSAATRMQLLINDLLSFSRVTTKAQPFVPVDLAGVVRDVLGDLEARLESTGGAVEVGDLPTIDADPTQMRQLFQNLIANALKFRRPDVPPVVRVSATLLAGGETPAARCEIRVADNGIGFDEKYLDRIFAVFQRLHGRDQYEGTGIGLAVCRKIAERHGGTITAASREGEGSTFIVTLPARHEVNPGEQTDAAQHRQADHDPASR